MLLQFHPFNENHVRAVYIKFSLLAYIRSQSERFWMGLLSCLVNFLTFMLSLQLVFFVTCECLFLVIKKDFCSNRRECFYNNLVSVMKKIHSDWRRRFKPSVCLLSYVICLYFLCICYKQLWPHLLVTYISKLVSTSIRTYWDVLGTYSMWTRAATNDGFHHRLIVWSVNI